MGFFHSEHKRLPLKGCNKKLPLRSERARRLNHLKQFEAGRLYTFLAYYTTTLPDDLPYNLLTEEHQSEQHRAC